MRAGQVARPRLVAQLERGGRGKLTLLSAPPGFGKTTLLAEWLAPLASSGDVAWVSLEQADNLPATFWRYVLTALAGAREEVKATGALELVEASRPPPIETPLGLVLNALGASARDLWLVLDDYHVIDNAEIARGMAYLVDHLPPQLHLVLASREDPALPLPRLRTRGELTDIRARDLRLTLEEADLFLNVLMGLELDSEDVARLEARTEGWAGALQLAALSLRGRDSRTEFIRAFSGDDRYIVDYLVDEVLQRQPDDVREFLLRTSILDRLSSPLCDAVTGGTSARAMLDNLERNNLFVVPLDDQRRWSRYHQLFSDVLKAQLADLHTGEVAPLHQRASDWYAANGEPDRAIQHALAAKDFVRAASVIELQAETVVRHHHPDRLIAWLKAIPPRVIATMPVLSTYYGHALQGMGDMEGSAARLDDAERLLTETGAAQAVVVDQRSFAMLPALISVGRGYLAMAARDTRATVTFAEDVLSRVSEEDYHWLGTSTGLLGLAHWFEGELEPAQEYQARAVGYFELEGDTGLAITSAYHDAELLKARGRLGAAQRRLESMLARVMEEGGAAARGAANLHLGLSDIHCERNDLEAAAVELANADRLGVFPPRTPFRRCLVEARLSQVRGDLEGAIRLLDEAERLQIRGAVPDTRPVAAWRAGLWAAQGRFGDAMDWARTQGIAVTDEPRYARTLCSPASSWNGWSQGTPRPPPDCSNGCSRRRNMAADSAPFSRSGRC